MTALFFLVQLPFLSQLSLLRGERDILLSGFSLARTGRDLYGKFLPLEFLGIDPNVPFFPMYLTALWWLIIPIKSVFVARLFFVILSLTVPFLLDGVMYQITKDRKISLITTAIFVFSPGVFHLTRLALEIGIALPLLLAGMYCFLKGKKKLAFLFFFLMFFSYQGFRPLFPFLYIYLQFYEYLKDKKFKPFLKNSFIYIGLFVLLVGLSFITDGHLVRSRAADLAIANLGRWDNEVIYRRNTSQAPAIIKAVFDNKITMLGMYMKDVFLNAQGFRYLFLIGDDASIYATTFTGQFFILFFILYYLGLFYVGRIWKKEYLYILGLIPLGLIPSLVNVSYVSYSIRSILSSVGYSFLFAAGAVFGIHLLRQAAPVWRKVIIAVLLLCFGIELTYFGYNYYGRRYITMSELFFESERQIATYLVGAKKPYHIYTSSPRDVFFSYLFFNNKLDLKTVHEAAKNGAPYKIDGMMIEGCPQKHAYSMHMEIIGDPCLTDTEYSRLKSLKNATHAIDYTNYSFRTAFFVFD